MGLLQKNHKDHRRNNLNINYLVLLLSAVNLIAMVRSFAIQIHFSYIYYQEDFPLALKYFQRKVYFLLGSTLHLWANFKTDVRLFKRSDLYHQLEENQIQFDLIISGVMKKKRGYLVNQKVKVFLGKLYCRKPKFKKQILDQINSILSDN